MRTIYKTASLGISELSGKARYTQEHRELAAMKAQRDELGIEIRKLEAALRKAGLESLKEVPVKWKVGDVVKCMCGDADFAHGRLYKKQLIAEAKRIAEYKLRADKLDMQHKMQSHMRREALEKVVKLLGKKS